MEIWKWPHQNSQFKSFEVIFSWNATISQVDCISYLNSVQRLTFQLRLNMCETPLKQKWCRHHVSLPCSHKLATLGASYWKMTPKTQNANQLTESKPISQLRHWQALRKWLSRRCTSTGSGLVPTFLAFQDELSPRDLICLAGNCNNYTALVKPVSPISGRGTADGSGGGRRVGCRKWRWSRARCCGSSLRQIRWILGPRASGETPLLKNKRPGNTRSHSRHMSLCVFVRGFGSVVVV